jgi:hypothetical protein
LKVEHMPWRVVRGGEGLMVRKSAGGRRGFVLLTVVVVSALLILSSLMFGAQLSAESRITKTDAMFKNALSVAEAGLNNTLSDIRNATSDAWAKELQERGGDSVGPEPVASMHGAYEVDVAVIGSRTSLPDNQYRGTILIGSTGAVYPPSVALSDMATSADYTARRRIETLALATWTYVPLRVIPGSPEVLPGAGSPAIEEVGSWNTTSFGINYGVFTQGDFDIGGNAKEVNGDVYAGGNATIGGLKNIVNGKVYASGELQGKYPAGSKGGVPRIPFPEIETAYYRALFTAYVNGTFPYNAFNNPIPGTSPAQDYTCTNPLVVGNMRSAYQVDDLRSLTQEITEGGKTYRVIPSDHASAALAYMTNPTAAYFVEGDLHVSGQTELTGTLVVHGNFVLNGGAKIVSGPKMPAILVTGDFDRNNGNAATYGLVYAMGNFTGSGTGDIYGALISGGDVKMRGTMNVYYDPSLGSLVTAATWVVTQQYVPAVPPTQGRAAVPDQTIPAVYRIEKVQQLLTGRSWVEVAPQS